MTDDTTPDTPDTDEPVLGVDLTTWEPPPMIEPHLADSVIARMQRVVPTTRPRNRRAWLAGGALVAAAAGGIVTFAVTRGTPRSTPVPGTAIARPSELTARVFREFPGTTYDQKVELGDTTVTLAVNAGFRAAREGTEIYIEDARGEATWQVGGHDRVHVALGKTKGFGLLVEPGGMVVTRIHTNADEPVHVEVAPSDGAHVHAYREGHAWEVTKASQSLVIDLPAASWRIVDDSTPIIDPFATCDDHRRAADRHLLRDELAAQIAELEAAYACDGRASDAAGIAGLACARHDEATARHYFELASGEDAHAAATTCRTDGIELEARQLHTGCLPEDIEGYKAKGAGEIQAGQGAAALRDFERVYLCKPDDRHIVTLAVLSACMAGDEPKAKAYYAKCGPACTSLVARCQSFRITLP